MYGKLALYLCYLIFVGAPSPPEKVRVTVIEKNSVTVEWMKPSSDGGSRIRRFIIYQRIEMTDKWVKVTSVEQFTTKAVIEKLEFEKNYFFAVSAENDIGESEKAETSQPTKLGKPTGKVNIKHAICYKTYWYIQENGFD